MREWEEEEEAGKVEGDRRGKNATEGNKDEGKAAGEGNDRLRTKL